MMKSKTAAKLVFVIFYVVSTTTAFPASSDSETELIDTRYGDQPIVDTGIVPASGFGYDIFQSMESIMRRMREQMDALLNNFGSSNATDVEQFPGFGFPPLPNVDLGKGNTTSVTKVINGHKVVINETKFGQENENGGAFFKVRVIEVKPENSNGPSVNSRDIESVENLKDAKENEITKEAWRRRYDIVPFRTPSSRKFYPIARNRWSELEDLDAENRIDAHYPPYDLGRDTYVNNLLAAKRYPLNPNAEFIDRLQPYSEQRENDLSRDILVNRFMERQGAIPDPNAEFIDIRKK